MSNTYFQFKQFFIHQDRTAMKVTTDGCLFGAWVAEKVRGREIEDRGMFPPANLFPPTDKKIYLLDIGTGTGLLSLMIAQKNPFFNIDAVELDKLAFDQAKENVAASPYKERVNIIPGDAKTFLFQKPYDIIISNPPFYQNELKGDDNQKNLAHHDEGLLLPELLLIIKKNLVPDGKFYLLLPYKRNAEIKNLLNDHDLEISEMILVRQSPKHDYFRIMLEGKLKQDQVSAIEVNEMAIKDGDQEYSANFIALLKDYYLKL